MNQRTSITIIDKMDYDRALVMQLEEKELVASGKSSGTIFLLEHDPPVITLGRQSTDESMLVPKTDMLQKGYQIREINRGGDVTFHEPGQLVIYFVLPVASKMAGPFVKKAVDWVMGTLNKAYGIGCRFDHKIPGLWVGDRKIGSIGFDLRGGVSTHGIAVNVCNSLEGFNLIAPCGHKGTIMTTLSRELNRTVVVKEVVDFLLSSFRNKKDL